MKTKLTRLIGALALLALLTVNHQLSIAQAQGTAFTYQGRLNSGGSPASGLFDFRFRLDADPLGDTVLATVASNAMPVTNGLFLTALDFGPGWFNGTNYWLEIDVRANGTGGYDELFPLQILTPTPYAIFATTASNVSGTVSAAQLSGTVASGNLPSSPTVSGTVTAGAFTGNGGNVTNVNAAMLNGLTPANFWQLGGNNVSAGQFIGGTNYQPVEFWVNAGRALRLEPGINGAGAPNVIGGAQSNFVASGVVGATIGGGGATNYNGSRYINSVSAHFGTVGGGGENTAGDQFATVGGGFLNSAGGYGATVPGGDFNEAAGQCSFAAGQNAHAAHASAFVWADSQYGPFYSTTADQFLIRAQGGVGINKNNPATDLDVNGTASASIFLGGSIGIGTVPAQPLDVLGGQASACFTSTNNGSGSVMELKNTTPGTTTLGAINFNNAADGYPGQIAYASSDAIIFRVGGYNRMTLDSSGLTVNGTFVSSSDRNVKQDFQPVDSRGVLEKVSQLPVQTWAYKNDPGTKHLGPMAQDFYAAFGTGADDKHIAVVDESGVALAAIQGLNQKLNDKDAEMEALKQSVAELKQLVQSLAEKK
jgi:hypothetical protein